MQKKENDTKEPMKHIMWWKDNNMHKCYKTSTTN